MMGDDWKPDQFFDLLKRERMPPRDGVPGWLEVPVAEFCSISAAMSANWCAETMMVFGFRSSAGARKR